MTSCTTTDHLHHEEPALDETALEVHASSDAQHLMAQARRLVQVNARFEVALNNMARGLSMFDAERRLIVCNGLYRHIYDLPKELTAPGTPFSRIIAYHAAREGCANTVDDLNRQHLWIEAHAAELKIGQTFTRRQQLDNGRIVLVTVQPLQDGGWVDIQEDITDRALAEERNSWLARNCPLTEVANRFHLRERLEEVIVHMPPGGRLAVHLIDLDYFKRVNDTLGHAAGDAVLKAVAKRMRAAVRDRDFVGRLGGDEFAIVQPDIEGLSSATSLADRLAKVLNAPYRVNGTDVIIGASIGIALFPDHGPDADALLRKADMALYRMKTSARGRSCVFTPEDEAALSQRMELSSALRDALKNRQIGLHYQPIVDIKAGRVTGCEALMRWHHPLLGAVPPSTFIPIAERSGLMLAMGDWALNQACRDAAGWSQDIKVAVNMSAVQLDHGGLAHSVERALMQSGLAAGRLEIEITEAALVSGEARTLEALETLRGLGVRLVLDDFGAGFGSLSHLRSFAFDKIKIDQCFISEMAGRRDCRAIVGAVAGLAKVLGMGPVAEGVEGLAELEGVSCTGCNEMQGFYFSRPVPSVEIEAALARCATQLARAAQAS
ncbi:MAG: putative bifunctional diguanylate cyclase/phosphodiesterase [Hyphomicrobium sp.]|uniref:putative bifunctional diguanylate cyclase/phosphodiesterase n=1 Tax=Hyphomicrobium sp. TaxID=82 RepID=UPI003D0A9233